MGCCGLSYACLGTLSRAIHGTVSELKEVVYRCLIEDDLTLGTYNYQKVNKYTN